MGLCQAVTRPSANDAIGVSESCGQESRAVSRGGEKGQPPPIPGAGALRGAEPGPRCLTLGDHGHPESQQRAQTSMLSSLRPCPAPLPLHAMCPGRLSARLSSLLSMALGHRALRAGWEQGVGGEGLGTCTRGRERDGRRARLLRRAGGALPPCPRAPAEPMRPGGGPSADPGLWRSRRRCRRLTFDRQVFIQSIWKGQHVAGRAGRWPAQPAADSRLGAVKLNPKSWLLRPSGQGRSLAGSGPVPQRPPVSPRPTGGSSPPPGAPCSPSLLPRLYLHLFTYMPSSSPR